MLFDIAKGEWDDELLKIFGVPRSMLPEVRSSSEVYGTTTLLGAPMPIAGIAGDQQAALFGQACTKPGMAKNTYGTGCFMLMNTGTKRIASKNNLLTTVAWRIGDHTEYALEGSTFIAGAVVQWLRDGLEFFRAAPDIEAPAATVTDTGGVYPVRAAYLAGLAVGYWKSQADIARQWQVDKKFTPAMRPAARKQIASGWERALGRAKAWEPADY